MQEPSNFKCPRQSYGIYQNRDSKVIRGNRILFYTSATADPPVVIAKIGVKAIITIFKKPFIFVLSRNLAHRAGINRETALVWTFQPNLWSSVVACLLTEPSTQSSMSFPFASLLTAVAASATRLSQIR